MSETNPAAPPEPTEIAGRYEVLQKLGAGAFGTVHKAKDRLLGRMVAIKTIRLEGLAAANTPLEELLKRFKQEATVAANLKHPNIVTIYDIGESAGLSYIAMEFIDGEGLDRIVARSGKLGVERAASLGIQVADALAFAHRHGVIHRDIKPANIMVEAGDHVKVTDFGIAKATDSAEHLTITGSLLGTPSYMSPEQARGGTLDGRSDLFSVGCLLYEMVAGRKAFRGETITALLLKILTEDPPPIRELDPAVPDEMERLIAKALAKSPEARYQSGRELADDLLALTRPGFVPTLRAADSPTLPEGAPGSGVPTIVAPPTARAEATISSRDTAARPAGASSTQPAPAGPPPLPPTILTPATAHTVPAPPPRRPVTPRAPQAAVPAGATARKGGAGLLIGLGAVVLVLVVAIGVGGRFILKRRQVLPEPAASPVAEAAAEATPAPAEPTPPSGTGTLATEGTRTPAEPTAESGRPSAWTPAAAPPPVPTPDRAATGSGTSVPPAPADAPATAAGAGDYGYLDEVPPEGSDGRAAGEALAGKYRSGGSTGYTTGRFTRRERFPRDLVPAERPAAATLGYILVAEEKYHGREGRYGTLRELADAQLFFLDVPFAADGFQRARYRFRVTVAPDGFRAEATPVGPVGRPLLVDDSGFVRIDRE